MHHIHICLKSINFDNSIGYYQKLTSCFKINNPFFVNIKKCMYTCSQFNHKKNNFSLKLFFERIPR